ncbi:hypothetical protein MSAN_00413500 [Mycena sanguinolenta]|uniref:Uncharacterized protein n=1 Tax=Mycena sanguinolenta TaxID=230812 RepID=A0A8H7DK45_9AGAR|nr:hypothetical protein MSAN_00413500 [Mycena sanguinolenta]
MFEPHPPEPSFPHSPCPVDQWFSGRPKRESPHVAPPASSTFLSSTNDLRNWTSALDIWFPVDENASSSWPPKITFSEKKSSQSSHNAPDAMEGVISWRPKIARTRSATRAIPNRISRSTSLSSVPSTPTNLWRDVSSPKGQDPTRLPASSGNCPHATLNPERTRSADIVAGPRSKHESVACCGPLLQPVLPSASHISPGPTNAVPSVLTQWDEHERMFLRLWNAQKRTNPYLPLVVSFFNPLRALMPPLHWKSINTAELNKPFAKIEWNFQRPLPSPALRTKLRSREYARCDAAAERLSIKGFLTGKLQSHCRDCSKDTLLKRLLLVRHWASELSKDALFESALSLIHDDDDYEMGDDDARLDDCFPEGVHLRDRNGSADDDDRLMDDAPSTLDCDSAAKCYLLDLS